MLRFVLLALVFYVPVSIDRGILFLVCPSVCPSVYSSVHPSVHPSVCLSVPTILTLPLKCTPFEGSFSNLVCMLLVMSSTSCQILRSQCQRSRSQRSWLPRGHLCYAYTSCFFSKIICVSCSPALKFVSKKVPCVLYKMKFNSHCT